MQGKAILLRNMIWALLLQGLFVASAFAETAEHAVQQAYQNWCNAISTAHGRSSEVVKYYAPNAILLPTLSPDILFNREDGGKHEYFVALTSKKDVKCTPEKLITRMYGDMAINAGFYRFSYMDESGHEKEIPARFTFVYQKIGHHWLIVNHHSSVVPKA
jgi:hypothetical protein